MVCPVDPEVSKMSLIYWICLRPVACADVDTPRLSRTRPMAGYQGAVKWTRAAAIAAAPGAMTYKRLAASAGSSGASADELVDTRRSSRGAAAARPAATRLAPAPAAPRCDGCAADARWCPSSNSGCDRSGGDLCLDARRRDHVGGPTRSGSVTAGLAPMTTAATQQGLADDGGHLRTAPVTVRDCSPGPTPGAPPRCSGSTPRAARRQQTYGRGWVGTVTRGVSSARPGATRRRGMARFAPQDHADSAGRRTGPRGAGRVERSPRHNKVPATGPGAAASRRAGPAAGG